MALSKGKDGPTRLLLVGDEGKGFLERKHSPDNVVEL